MDNQAPGFIQKFRKERHFQFRVLAIAGGLLFFILPALVSGALLLFDFFISNSGGGVPKDPAGHILIGDTINLFFPRLAIIGILFGIGLFALLIASRGDAQLENVFIGLGLVIILAVMVVDWSMTQKCSDANGCDQVKFVVAVVSLVAMSLLAYFLPVSTGKKIGWYALFLIPGLLFQAFVLKDYLLADIQSMRIDQKVINETTLLFITASLIAWIGLTGGWKR